MTPRRTSHPQRRAEEFVLLLDAEEDNILSMTEEFVLP